MGVKGLNDKVFYLYVFFSISIFASGNELWSEEKIGKEYGRELLKKYGLLICLSENKNIEKDLRKAISKNEVYYFQRMFHSTSTGTDEDFSLYIDVFKPYFDSKKSDNDGIDDCLAIYESDEYINLIHSYDMYMSSDDFYYNTALSEMNFHFNNIVPYKILNKDLNYINNMYFYDCLSTGLPEKVILKDKVKELLRKIEGPYVYDTSNFVEIRDFYEKIRSQYEDQGFPILGCFIVYDSSFINNKMNSSQKLNQN